MPPYDTGRIHPGRLGQATILRFALAIATAFAPLRGDAFQTAGFSIKPPPHWTESPGMFSSDVILMSPLVHGREATSIFIKTLPRKMTDEEAPKFLREQIDR